MTGSNLATERIPAYSGNYTKGRNGKRISEIALHHMAARWTARRCGEAFQVVGRQGSSHYGIGYDGEIAQYVSEADTAWTNGDWEANCRAVTVECANESAGGDWRVSGATLSALIRLVADIAKRNGLYPLVKGENLTWHQMYSATACPGPYLLSKLDEIVAEANKLIEGNGKPVQTDVPCAYQVFTDRWLPNVTGRDVNDAENGFAGILGVPVSGVLASAYGADVIYKVHTLGGSWLPEVKNREDFAGILGRPIDGFMIRSDKTTIHYRVHTMEDGWLPPVTGYSEADHENGYAGILGHTIDGVILWAEPIITVIEKAPEPTPTPDPVMTTEENTEPIQGNYEPAPAPDPIPEEIVITADPPPELMPETNMEPIPDDTPAERSETSVEETLPELCDNISADVIEQKHGKFIQGIITLFEFLLTLLKGGK